MTLNLGMVRPGSTILIPFHAFDSNDPSASVIVSDFILADIGIYKGTSTDERASTTGVVLLDTDGINIDGATGVHGFSIDLSSNATAGFYSAGSHYYVTVGPITVDAAAINFVAATFSIGYPDAIINTTIASVTDQTQFILTVGPAEADVLIGCPILFHDVASAVQLSVGYITDYIVTTKEVFIAADPGGFTFVATDNVSIFMPANVRAVGGTLQTAGDIPAAVITNAAGVDIAADIIAVKAETVLIVEDTGELQSDDVPGLIATAQTDLDTITGAAGVIIDDSAANDTIMSDAIWDEDATGHQAGGSFGQAIGDPGANAETMYDAVVTDAAGTNVAADIIVVKAETAAIVDDTDLIDDGTSGLAKIATDVAAVLIDTAVIGALGAGLTNIPWNASWDAEVESEVNDALDTAISELGVAQPTATPTIRTALMLMYMALRDKLVVQTSGTDALEIYDDAGTLIAKKLLTDDGSDLVEDKMTSG